MRKSYIWLLLIIICSFQLSGCSRKIDGDAKLDSDVKINGDTKLDGNVKIDSNVKLDSTAKMVNKAMTVEDYPSCICPLNYLGVAVELPENKKITDEDIQEQIAYALKGTGESTLTSQNVKAVSGYDSIEEYKKVIKKKLEKLNESSRQNELMNRAWDAALKQAVLIKYPKDMLDSQITQVKAGYKGYIGVFGKSYEEVLNYFGVTEDDIQTKALNYVKSDLLVYAIAKAENIAVNEEEYKQEVKKRIKFFGVATEKELADKMGNGADLHYVFLADKVMQFVYENAHIGEDGNSRHTHES